MKITIAEDTPASAQELAWITELKQLHGQRLVLNNVSALDLLRFCRANVNNDEPKKSTFETVSTYLDWRERSKIGELACLDQPRHEEFVTMYPSGFCGLDKTNHPVYFDCIGQMNPSSFSKAFSMDEIKQHHICMMEDLQDIKAALTELLGKPIYKHTIVIDFNGFGLKHFWDHTAMTELVSLDTTKYPETLHKMLILNPPLIFKAIFAMFSALLDETTTSCIHILKDTSELLNHIDASQLPKKYGGLIQYPANTPLFSLPFATAAGHSGEFDDIFTNLLEKRRARLAVNNQMRVEMAAAGDSYYESLSALETATEETPLAPSSSTAV